MKKNKASKNILCFFGIHYFISKTQEGSLALSVKPTFGGAWCDEVCIRCGKKRTKLYKDFYAKRIMKRTKKYFMSLADKNKK